jgi:hypothetical protein
MTDTASSAALAAPVRGDALRGRDARRIGTVDAVFADYLLVRTSGLLPIDLYVPRRDVVAGERGWTVDCDAREAYARWHRPLKRAPHDDG